MGSSKFSSTKVIPLGSCAFRQPYATSHCRYIHGYRLQAKFWFTCNVLDTNNWVVDFGALKGLKNLLEETFDHKTVVWSKDPEITTFRQLHSKGMIDLVVFENGVGIEKFAEHCLTVANKYVRDYTGGRCWCEKVEVWEHEGNSALVESTESVVTLDQPVKEPITINTAQTVTTTVDTKEPPVLISEVKQEAPPPQPTVVPEPTKRIVPQYTDKSKNTYKDLFKGTSWGNPK